VKIIGIAPYNNTHDSEERDIFRKKMFKTAYFQRLTAFSYFLGNMTNFLLFPQISFDSIQLIIFRLEHGVSNFIQK